MVWEVATSSARPRTRTSLKWWLMAVVLWQLGAAMPVQREPLQKKGAKAWMHAKTHTPVWNNRLVIHAVDDETNRNYQKAVMAFLKYARLHDLPFNSYEARDKSMAKYLEHQCYVDLTSVNTGSLAFFGFLHIFEDHRDKMPTAARALKAWQRLAQGNEGGPISRETVGILALAMIISGKLIPAMVVLLSFDCFLREQDWQGLVARDCARDPNGNIALLFGVRERGEKVKTGSNQGVVIKDRTTAKLMHALLDSLQSDDMVFPMTATAFRRQWWQILKAMGLEFCGPPHNLRHAGAATFVEEKGDLEECRRRGRWSVMSSVQRYTKVHWLGRHRAQVPPRLLAAGRSFWTNPKHHLFLALKLSKADQSELKNLMLNTLNCKTVSRSTQTAVGAVAEVLGKTFSGDCLSHDEGVSEDKAADMSSGYSSGGIGRGVGQA